MNLEDRRASIPHEEYEARKAQAERRAQWELGDPSWAGVILGAFFYPEADAEALDAAKEER